MADLKEQLKNVDEKLQGLAQTKSICEAMLELGNIKVEQVKELKEGETPLVINLNGDISRVVLNPLLAFVGQRREQFLNVKEQLLQQMSAGVNGEVDVTPPADVTAH
jgi:hypothetical protein